MYRFHFLWLWLDTFVSDPVAKILDGIDCETGFADIDGKASIVETTEDFVEVCQMILILARGGRDENIIKISPDISDVTC